MIKVIALDLIGVLIRKDDRLLEPGAGLKASPSIFDRLKIKYPHIKVVIASNYDSYIRPVLEYNYPACDKIFLSSEISYRKPQREYFNYILDSFEIAPNELLFLDDSYINTSEAGKMGIETITIDEEDDILSEIDKLLSKNG